MNWYKIAQSDQSEHLMGTPQINIQPHEPLILEAVNELQAAQPGILDNVTDINIDIGYGQFGSVTNVSPNTININMNRIKEEAAQQTGKQISISDPEDTKILKHFIKQTIIHELGHIHDIGKSTDPSNPFPGGESVAERAQDEWVGANPIV